MDIVAGLVVARVEVETLEDARLQSELEVLPLLMVVLCQLGLMGLFGQPRLELLFLFLRFFLLELLLDILHLSFFLLLFLRKHSDVLHHLLGKSLAMNYLNRSITFVGFVGADCWYFLSGVVQFGGLLLFSGVISRLGMLYLRCVLFAMHVTIGYVVDLCSAAEGVCVCVAAPV